MGYAISGGPYVYRTWSGANKTTFLKGLDAALRAADWVKTETTTAYCIGTFNAQPSAGWSVTLDGQSYVFRSVIDDTRAGDVLLGADADETIRNLAAAINNGTGAGTVYSSATPEHATLSAATPANDGTLKVMAKTSGPAGNNLACLNSGTFISSWRADADATAGKTAYGGFKLTGASPQVDVARTVGLYLFDAADPTAAMVQFYSVMDGGLDGYRHPLKCAEGLTYQIVANPCQFFLSRPGVRVDVNGSAVCGGIPFVTEDLCADFHEDFAVDEIWWSMGDGRYYPFSWSSNPRGNLLTHEYNPETQSLGTRACEAYLNGAYISTPSGIGAPRILCLTGPTDIDQIEFLHQTFSPFTYWDDAPLDYEALLAWGDTNDSAPLVRAQVWDAFIRSTSTAMDAVWNDGTYTWINYTDRFFYGALYLLKAKAVAGAAPGNYVY